MKTFDFVCKLHPETQRVVRAESLGEVDTSDLFCPECGEALQRFFGKMKPQVALKGSNWPKRDIKETAYRKRRSAILAKRQEKTWKGRGPKLNLNPDVQRYYKEKLARKNDCS